MREEERLADETGELQAQRARFQADASGRSAAIQRDLQDLQTQEAQLRAESNRSVRIDQERLNELNERVVSTQRTLETLRRKLSESRSELTAESVQSQADQLANQRTRELKEQLDELSNQRDELAAQLESLAPVVEAQREATSSVGAHNLGQAYETSADGHKKSWKRWLFVLAVSFLLAGIGGPITIAKAHPGGNPSLPETISGSATALLVVGLLLYLVRICALQFRVHRHLETVDRNKAAALSTYNGIVAAASTPEVRNAIASALAEAVFSSDESGFIDASSDHITLIERIVGPAAQRLAP